MILNPIVALIHNVEADRWHPVIFKESPLPGPYDPNKPVRHKSGGHHSVGFDTRDAAVANIHSELVPGLQKATPSPVMLALGKDFPWDGKGTPALVCMFPIDQLSSAQKTEKESAGSSET